MIGKMTVDVNDLPLWKIPILVKEVGVKVVGTFLGIKKTEFGAVDIFVVQTKHACYGRIGHLGELMLVMPGGVVGFGLNDSEKVFFRFKKVEEGNDVSLSIIGSHDVGGRRFWDEILIKVGDASSVAAEPPKAASSSRSWADILASAKDAYSSTGGNFRDKMLLLAGSLIDFDSDRDVAKLISEASFAKKAYDKEIIEHGQCKTADDGESNWTRWRRAADSLAKALVDGMP